MSSTKSDSRPRESSVELVLAYVRDQDAAAADRIYYRHRDFTLRLARAGMSSPLQLRVDAEDVYQSVSMILLDGLRDGRFQIRQAGDLRALIAQLTRQRILKNAEHHTAGKRAVGREIRCPSPRQLPCRSGSPLQTAERTEVIDWLLQSTVNPRHCSVIRLALNGANVPEIAERCGYSQARVRQILEASADRAQREHGGHDS